MPLRLGNPGRVFQWSSFCLPNCIFLYGHLNVIIRENIFSDVTKKIGLQKRFTLSKQLFGIDKMSPLLLRLNLPQIFPIYDTEAL